jgi:hypothetical protein
MLPNLDPPRPIITLALGAHQESLPELELAFRSPERNLLPKPKLMKVLIVVEHYDPKHTFIWAISIRIKTFLEAGHETTEGGMSLTE